MPDVDLPTYHAELARLATTLGRPDTPLRRDEIKSEIIALYKQVDRDLAALAGVKDEILALIGRWKTVPEPGSHPVPESPMVQLLADSAQSAPGERRTGSVMTVPPPASERQGSGELSPVRVMMVVDPPPAARVASGAPTPAHPARAVTVRADHLGASTFIEKGWNQIAAGDHVAAEASLRRALALAPDEPATETLLGWALMAQERHDEALHLFQRVLQSDPENALARVNIGYICLKKGIWGESIEHLTTAIRLDNDRKATLYAHFYLGLVYFDREMYDDAQGFFRQSLALGPNLIEAYYELGRAHWFAEDADQARAAWQSGFAANKFNAWGKRCGEMLEHVRNGGSPPRSL